MFRQDIQAMAADFVQVKGEARLRDAVALLSGEDADFPAAVGFDDMPGLFPDGFFVLVLNQGNVPRGKLQGAHGQVFPEGQLLQQVPVNFVLRVSGEGDAVQNDSVQAVQVGQREDVGFATDIVFMRKREMHAGCKNAKVIAVFFALRFDTLQDPAHVGGFRIGGKQSDSPACFHCALL